MKLPFRGHRTARCAVSLGAHATHFFYALNGAAADAAHRQGERLQARHGGKC